MNLVLATPTLVDTGDLAIAVQNWRIKILNGNVTVTPRFGMLEITNGTSGVGGEAVSGFVLLDKNLPQDVMGAVLSVCRTKEWACGFTLGQAIPYLNVFILGSEEFGEENGNPLENEGYLVERFLYVPNQTLTGDVVAVLTEFMVG